MRDRRQVAKAVVGIELGVVPVLRGRGRTGPAQAVVGVDAAIVLGARGRDPGIGLGQLAHAIGRRVEDPTAVQVGLQPLGEAIQRVIHEPGHLVLGIGLLERAAGRVHHVRPTAQIGIDHAGLVAHGVVAHAHDVAGGIGGAQQIAEPVVGVVDRLGVVVRDRLDLAQRIEPLDALVRIGVGGRRRQRGVRVAGRVDAAARRVGAIDLLRAMEDVDVADRGRARGGGARVLGKGLHIQIPHVAVTPRGVGFHAGVVPGAIEQLASAAVEERLLWCQHLHDAGRPVLHDLHGLCQGAAGVDAMLVRKSAGGAVGTVFLGVATPGIDLPARREVVVVDEAGLDPCGRVVATRLHLAGGVLHGDREAPRRVVGHRCHRQWRDDAQRQRIRPGPRDRLRHPDVRIEVIRRGQRECRSRHRRRRLQRTERVERGRHLPRDRSRARRGRRLGCHAAQPQYPLGADPVVEVGALTAGPVDVAGAVGLARACRHAGQVAVGIDAIGAAQRGAHQHARIGQPRAVQLSADRALEANVGITDGQSRLGAQGRPGRHLAVQRDPDARLGHGDRSCDRGEGLTVLGGGDDAARVGGADGRPIRGAHGLEAERAATSRVRAHAAIGVSRVQRLAGRLRRVGIDAHPGDHRARHPHTLRRIDAPNTCRDDGRIVAAHVGPRRRESVAVSHALQAIREAVGAVQGVLPRSAAARNRARRVAQRIGPTIAVKIHAQLH